MTDSVETATVRPYYRQFYLRRGDAEWRSDEISAEGYEAGIEELSGFVYIGTTTFGSPTQVTVYSHSSEPGVRPADKVAEVTIGGSGDLHLLSWEPGEPAAATIAVPAGVLRARMSWTGTADAASHPDCEVGGDDVSPEKLVLDLWPDA